MPLSLNSQSSWLGTIKDKWVEAQVGCYGRKNGEGLLPTQKYRLYHMESQQDSKQGHRGMRKIARLEDPRGGTDPYSAAPSSLAGGPLLRCGGSKVCFRRGRGGIRKERRERGKRTSSNNF